MPKRNKRNGLETKFEGILKDLNLKYKFHFIYKGKEYDFLLLDYDIVFEIDGDWWHVNKEAGYKPLHEIQKKNIKNDRYKDKLIEKSKEYTLIRFWETDINQDPKSIKKRISELIFYKEMNNTKE